MKPLTQLPLSDAQSGAAKGLVKIAAGRARHASLGLRSQYIDTHIPPCVFVVNFFNFALGRFTLRLCRPTSLIVLCCYVLESSGWTLPLLYSLNTVCVIPGKSDHLLWSSVWIVILERIMGRQLPPSHLKVPPGPYVFPQRHFMADTVLVNSISGFEKAIPTLPGLPGLRTSATFLTSLSANLQIDPDLPSPLGTPTTFRIDGLSHYPLPPTPLSFSTLPAAYNPYPSPAASEKTYTPKAKAPIQPPTQALPQLSTYTAESEDDRVEGLRIVADSVAHQRQTASKTLVSHPLNLAAYLLIVAIVTLYMRHDVVSLGTTIGSLTLMFLAAVRWMTIGYIGLAEDITRDWLGGDRLIVVKWGEDVIGALVLGWADNDASKKRGRRRRGKAVVRAWTVKSKYQGKGVGEGLLEEAVKVAGEKGADGIVFDGEHANSKRILPAIYNGFQNKQEAKAEKALRKVADEKGNFRQRQSSPTWGSR
ncbi:hypothetical protein P153DRAFT_367026 [Dothidotthia symphoricarpi CBS 119687]|uniref:N-acetyltransferase domain-containing protein n=1 Tax=Dothidotthia symphoricarpi CBS 119687 TaxID=1392245 RepID=A0A6A6ADL2_9PLEO|nr:uncharacterized protein P153DRAFT_367026 [Dothidotthia symphoricarpi CBS 119687]KAF2129646.1 hypothetical protein P153DRAFT_367026 [Dothidotthia symphoricarpi CBS 119687]